MTDRELLERALEALERCVSTCFDQRAHEQAMSRPEHFVNQNITALRERLAQQETVMAEYKFQTYAAYKTPDGEMKIGVVPDDAPRREWVGLTDEEKLHLEIMGGKSDVMLAEAIEAKLKEKNNG